MANIGDELPRETVAARFKAMSGSSALRVTVVGRRAVRIETARAEDAMALSTTICSILRCTYQWRQTDTSITVTIQEPS